jgi:putative transposon-encoded protein
MQSPHPHQGAARATASKPTWWFKLLPELIKKNASLSSLWRWKNRSTAGPPKKNEVNIVTPEKNDTTPQSTSEIDRSKVKFEIYGEEMIEKIVKSSGNSGRVYLPPNWVGHNVKIVRID